MGATAKLTIELDATISALLSKLNTAGTKLKQFADDAEEVGQRLSLALTVPITGFAAAAVKAYGDLEALEKGLEAVAGSAEQAAVQMQRLKELAKLPGLGLQEVAKGSINLQVIGFNALEAEDAIRAFGNAVATVGGSRDQFERALYGLTQLANTDFPLGEDLNIIKDAIPQVTPLLEEAFGASRSDDLKEMGIRSEQLVKTIVDGLSKLPPVTGGVNNSIENFKDSVTNNLAEIGESIDENFDIAGTINKLAEAMDSLVEKFRSMPPAFQKAVITLAGIAAAAGPVLGVLGVLGSTVIPAVVNGARLLGTAFTLATGPVGLIAAAVAGAVYLIYKYWDDLVAYFTFGKGAHVWQSLKNSVENSMTAIVDAWNELVRLIEYIWVEFGDEILAVTEFYFNNLATIVKQVFQYIAGIVRAVTAVIKGDWESAGNALVTLGKQVWNNLVSIVANGISTVSKLYAKLFDVMGMNDLAMEADAISRNIEKIIKKIFSFDLPEKGATFSFGEEELLPNLILKKRKRKNGAGGVDKDLLEIYKNLADQLKIIDNTIGLTFDDRAAQKIDAYQAAINALIKYGLDPASAAIMRLKAIQEDFLQLPVKPAIDLLAAFELPERKITPFNVNTLAFAERYRRKLMQIVDGMVDIANAGDVIAAAFEGINDTMSKLLTSMSGLVGHFANMKRLALEFYKLDPNDKWGKLGNVFGQIGQLFAGFASFVMPLGNLFGAIQQRNEERVAKSQELQVIAIEASNKALERQLTLTQQLYGDDRLKSYAKDLDTINRKQAENTAALSRRYEIQPGNDAYNYFIEQLNNGVQAKDLKLGRGADIFDLNNFLRDLKEGRVQSLQPFIKDLEKLQALADEGKLDAGTKALVDSLVELEKQAKQTQDALSFDKLGFRFDDLKNSIVSFFEAGNATAKSFSENLKGFIRKAIVQGFAVKYVEKAMQPLFDAIFKAAEDGLISEAELNGDGTNKGILGLGDELFKQLEPVFKSLDKIGLFGKSVSAGLEGAIREQLTESTASELTGIYRASFDVMKRMNDAINRGIDISTQISENTLRIANNTDRLVNIETGINKLVQNSSGNMTRALIG